MRARFLVILFCICGFMSACSSPNKKDASTSATAPAPFVTAAPTVPPIAPEKQVSKYENKMICKNAEDSRFLEIEKKSPVGCILMYSKFGKNSEIASSKKGLNHCERIRSKVEENLKNGGFECLKLEGSVATKN
ncbi:MAG: hypothetical protein JNM24_04035 [Bdellovibrionaceae bacterium]|nr:hypothetical protein [Pseudobdellovibrionaceae bacterium]